MDIGCVRIMVFGVLQASQHLQVKRQGGEGEAWQAQAPMLLV